MMLSRSTCHWPATASDLSVAPMRYLKNSPFSRNSIPSLPRDGGKAKLDGRKTVTSFVSSSRECVHCLNIVDGNLIIKLPSVSAPLGARFFPQSVAQFAEMVGAHAARHVN